MFVDQISAGNPDVRRQLLEMLAIAMTGTQLKYFYVIWDRAIPARANGDVLCRSS